MRILFACALLIGKTISSTINVDAPNPDITTLDDMTFEQES